MNVVVQCRCGGGTSAVSTEAQIVFGVVARVGRASVERQQAAAVSSGGQHQQPRPVVVWSCVHPVCCLYWCHRLYCTVLYSTDSQTQDNSRQLRKWYVNVDVDIQLWNCPFLSIIGNSEVRLTRFAVFCRNCCQNIHKNRLNKVVFGEIHLKPFYAVFVEYKNYCYLYLSLIICHDSFICICFPRPMQLV